MIRIAPSILSADFLHLEDDIRSIEESGADLVHLDIMDGNFVPNITFGPMIVSQIRKVTKLPFDAHLMIKDPTLFAPLFGIYLYELLGFSITFLLAILLTLSGISLLIWSYKIKKRR